MIELYPHLAHHPPIDGLQVLVLDQGKIAEFDSPHTLLQDRSSIFFGLCKATGRKEFAELQRMAAASAGAS